MMGNVHVPQNSRRTSAGGCVGRCGSPKKSGGGGGQSSMSPGGGMGGQLDAGGHQVVGRAGSGGCSSGAGDDDDSLSSRSLKAATANDCGARYIRHEEWLADVCGVSRRRSYALTRTVLLLVMESIIARKRCVLSSNDGLLTKKSSVELKLFQLK